jgi:hypothetical protein
MPRSIEEYCKSLTPESDTVFWCMGDETVLPLTINWVEHCKQQQIPLLYVALDLQSYHVMQSRVPTVHIHQGNHHVFVYKFIVGQQIMQCGFNWFYTDVDCVVKQDYTTTIKEIFSNGADAICQSVKQYAWLGDPVQAHGDYNCGTGMFGMKSTDNNIAICETDYLYTNGYDTTCQKFSNTHLKHLPNYQIDLLDPIQFPTGHNFDIDADWSIFHVTGKYAYEDWDNTKEYLGDSAKIASLKKLGLWYQ